MYKLIFILMLLIVSTVPALAQGRIYLPVITKNHCQLAPAVESMSNWKIIIPESTINKVLNPQAGTTGNFAAEAGTTVDRSTTYQHYGLYSYRVQSNANNEGVELTLSALANAIHYVTVRVRGTLPAAWDWSLDDATYNTPTLIESIDSNWSLYGFEFPAAQANASVKLSVHQNGAGSGDFYIDGIQVEEKEYWTTYCDGTQEGCEWLGAANAAISQRSAESRAGGREQDLQDDYSFNIGGMSGTGTRPQDLTIDEYAILPGGEMNNIKLNSRVFTLTGVISGTSVADFHSKKQTLANIFDPYAYPSLQPVKLRYQGATIHKEISAHYEGGLDGQISATDPCNWEQVAIRFAAPNPYWLEIGESAVELDTNDSATFTVIAGRLRSTGQWDNLGPPNAAGTYTNIQSFAEDATYIYIGGNFDNFDNIANADDIVRYNKQTGVFSAVGTGMTGPTGGDVIAMVVGPDGTLYASGRFTSAGGTAANYIASWDGSSWSALGTGLDDFGLTLAIGPDGTLYAGGSFLNAGGGGANYIASWDGSSWSALGTGLDAACNSIVLNSDGTLYAGGAFLNAGGSGANYIASWDGSSWSTLGTGLDDTVRVVALDNKGSLFAGGFFDTAGGNSAVSVAVWNGTDWSSLGSGVNAGTAVLEMAISADESLIIGGTFTSAGGIDLADAVARWNGYAWSHLDINFPGSANVNALWAGIFPDPVVNKKYDLFVGFDTDGTGTYGGLVAATNEGTAIAFPKIIYARGGGTTAVIETLRNERTGTELLFNYSLLDGETLTIDLAPTKKSIVSSMFGPRQDAVLPNSDFGTWSLLTGSNDVTSYINESGTPTLTKYMTWKDAYNSQD